MATDPTIQRALDAQAAVADVTRTALQALADLVPTDPLEAVAFWWNIAQEADDSATAAMVNARSADQTLRAIGTAAGFITEQAVRRRLAKQQ